MFMLLTRRLAIGGISAALVIAAISISYFSPTADFFLFSLSSFFIAVCIIMTDFKTALMSYVASLLLITAFFGIWFSLPFIFLFGLYPFIKGLLEKSPLPRVLTFLFKGVFFIALTIIGLLIFKDTGTAMVDRIIEIFRDSNILLADRRYLAILPILLILYIYDYALSLMITFFEKRIKNKIEIKSQN